MPSADLISDLEADERNRLESLLMEFDRAWGSTSLKDYGQRLSEYSNGRFRDLALGELVKIDLQRCWSSGAGRMLQEYLIQFPSLGDPQSVKADLIVAEFEARRVVDRKLLFSSYESRFPRQFEQAKQLIEQSENSIVIEPGNKSGDESQASIDTSRINKLHDTKTIDTSEALEDLPANFGRYRILKLLGAGAMGKVYLAHDDQLDRQVALKTPTFTGGTDDEMVTRFYREARSAAQIQHRNICPIYDVGEIDGRHFISMAFVKGRCMSDFIKPDKLPPQRTSAILVQRLAAALAEAHDHNVIHRDLKPANIMIDLKKEPIVMDFGLARQMDVESRVTQSGMAVGTPAYMSPEQIRGELDKVGTTADIYALGVILYELLSGQIPFRGPIAKVVYSIVHEQPVPPSQIREGIDPALEAICAKMMAKNQSERFQSMRDVAASLKKYLKGETKAKQPAISNAEDSNEKAPGSGSTKLNETGALNAFFAAQGTQDPLQTAIEPSKSVEPVPVVRPKTSSSSKRGGGRAKLIALGLGGAALLASVIIYLADGTRIEIEDGTQANVETNPDGTLKSITTGTQSTEKDDVINAVGGHKYSDREFVDLFPNGDLSGWRGIEGLWKWQNNQLVGTAGMKGKPLSKNTALCSERDFEDFELLFEVKLEAPSGNGAIQRPPNSGIQFRSNIIDRAIYKVAGPQADIGGKYWGSVYGEATTGMMHEANAGLIASTVRKGDWNQYRLRVDGDRVSITINDVQMVDRQFPNLPENGILGFQLHRGAVVTARFRNIRIRELNRLINSKPVIPVTDTESGTITIANQVGSSSLAASPDGRSFASAEAGNPARITVWNSRTGESISKFVVQASEGATPRDLSYTPDSGLLGYSIGDSFLTMDASSGKRQTKMDFSAAPAVVMFPKRSLALALFHEQNVHRLQRSDVPQRVRIWNWKTNKVLHDDVMPIQQGVALSFPSISPDERFVTFGWGHHHVRYDLSIDGEKASLGKRTAMEKLIRVRGPLVYSPDSKYAVASVKSSDFMGVFLDTESGKVLHRFDPRTAKTSNRGHEFGCNVAFTSDGKGFVSADHNGRVALWTFPDGKLTRELGQFRADANHNPPKVAVTNDDRAIIAGDNSDSRIVIHDLGITTKRTSASAARTNASLPKVDQASLGSMTPKEVLTSDEWEWSEPVFLGSFFGDSRNLDSELGSEFTTWYASLSGKDIQLYPIGRGFGKTDIWQFSRAPNEAKWARIENLGSVVNSTDNDGEPSLSADGLKMVFSSDRPVGAPWNSDLWITSRKSIGADWSRPVSLGEWANSKKWDGHPCFAENGQAVYFSSDRKNAGHGGSDLYVTRPHKERGWRSAENLGRTVNSSAGEMGPTVSSDGLVLVFFSPDRPGGYGNHDLWMTHRDSVNDSWSSPVNLGPRINTDNPEMPRAISSDGRMLLFVRVPLAGKGTEGHGIWVTHRVPKQGSVIANLKPTPTSAVRNDETWNELFNGENLNGWKQVHCKDVWNVHDGFIESRVRKGREKVRGWLETENAFMNFELAFEYFMPRDGNSGVFLRTKSGGSVIGKDQLEIQLLDDTGPKHMDGKPQHSNGAVYDVVAPNEKASVPASVWNQMNIRAVDSQVTVAVNGATVVDANLDDFNRQIAGRFQYTSPGPIALQWHGHSVRFRRIRVQRLDPAGNGVGTVP